MFRIEDNEWTTGGKTMDKWVSEIFLKRRLFMFFVFEK